MYRADSWATLKDVSPRPKDYEHEKSLNWAVGTLEVLRYVSGLGLDRYTGWQCPDEPKFINAGRVYKRGVAVNRVRELPTLPSHPTRIVDYPGDLAPYLAKDRFIIADKRAMGALEIVLQSVGIMRTLITVGFEWPGEYGKCLDAVADIVKRWRKFGEGRMKWTIIGGGGLIDVCAFAASCVGAQLDLLPTTLLAMVDAAIGGKNGINSEVAKNQIGSYYFPNSVVICPYFLATLPKEELFAGSWECIKASLIAGDLQLVDQWLRIIYTDPNDDWKPLLNSTVNIKSRLVDLDPFEISDRRLLLNLGHTLGHALEAVALSNESDLLRHGEAVGVGLIYALLLSKKLGKLSTADDLLASLRNHRGLLSKQQLAEKMEVTNLDNLWQKLSPVIFHDKKRRGHKVPWVVLKDQQDSDGFCAELTFIDDQQLLLDCWQQLLKVLA